MAERERALAPPYGGVFVPRTTVMEPDDVQRATWRMAHEILERNHGTDGVVLIGLQTGGVWIARRLAETVETVAATELPVGTLDVAFYRDDIGLRPVLPEATTSVPVDLTGRTVVLVDDVLFTGRTIRAAMDATIYHGRPKTIRLAAMVDRGFREFPIQADYVGKRIQTTLNQNVKVCFAETDNGKTEVYIKEPIRT